MTQGTGQRGCLSALVGCLLVLVVGGALVFLLAMAAFTALISSVVGASGGGGGPCGLLTPVPTVGHHPGGAVFVTQAQVQAQAATTTATPGPRGPVATGTPDCRAPTPAAAAVVTIAEQMAQSLYVNPTCHGAISFPNCYDTWYTTSFPQPVIQYGQQVCPGCAAWANGTYQCVSFVRGAYAQIHPMRLSANAFDLWATYQGQPGWTEIAAGAAASTDQRGLPLPGDVIVFQDASVGHVGIVIAVVPPLGGQHGSVEFANANSVSPYTTMPLLPDLTVDASSWPGYTVWGYIRIA